MSVSQWISRCATFVALAACSHTNSSTVSFGAAGPWTQAYGFANKNGIQLALDEINASPAWSNARRLEIVFADDSGGGVRAASIAQDFVDSTKIVAVVGHVTSGAMVAAAHVYDKHLAAIATTATSPALTGISPWTFRVIPSDSANGMTIARFANARGRKRAAVLYENNPYGRGLAENFRKSFAGQIISIDPIGEGADHGIEAYVSWYKREHPDVVFVAGTDASGQAFLEGTSTPKHLEAELIGGVTAGRRSPPSPVAEGALPRHAPFSAPGDPRRAGSANVRCRVSPQIQHDALNGTTPRSHTTQRRCWLMPSRTRRPRDLLSRKFATDLANLTEATAYHGVTGTIRFRPDGDPIGKEFVMTRIHQGALEVERGQ